MVPGHSVHPGPRRLSESFAGEMMSTTLIDLIPYEQPIKALLADAVSRFAHEHPDVVASMLVLDYSGFNPYVLVALDTPEHSAANVSKFLEHDWAYGKDEYGTYCNSPWDCAYQLADYRFDGFPDLYKADRVLWIISSGGATAL